MFFGLEREITFESPSGLFGAERCPHPVGAGKFGHNQTAATQIADKAPENRIGNAGHRSQNGSRRDLNGADTETSGETHVFILASRVSGMKPLYVILLIFGAAFAGGLAYHLTQPQPIKVAIATPPPPPVTPTPRQPVPAIAARPKPSPMPRAGTVT